LRDHFAARHVLLVLDNFEHLLAAASVITDLLGSCPDLCVVVTSRAALRVAGEYEYAVPPLELPAAELSTARQLAEIDAVNLFVERARAVDARFKLVDQNALAVAAICRRLDGVPLAIELAAARVRVLSPEALLARLDRPLPLLVGQRRDVPARQQTLRAALKWSFDLLTQEEQALFRRVAVFVGGWTAEAAESVCALHAEERTTVLDRLEALTAHSQVQFNGPRFTMLETVREFAQDELERSGEHERIPECHAAFFVAWAEQGVPLLERTEGAAWLDALERDHANLQAALRWAIETGKVDWALRLGDALRLFWGMRGHSAVGRSLVEAALARAGDTVNAALRARALDAVGYLARCQGDWAAARPFFEQALAVRRQLGDRHGVADALINVGGALQREAQRASARECYEDALRIYRELDHKQGIAEAVAQLGHLETDEEHLDLARSLHEQSLALWRELGDQFGVGWALGHLADLAVLAGEVAPAQALLAESIRINSGLLSAWGVASALEGFAKLAVAERRTSRALRLAGAAAALRAQAGSRLAPSDETWLQQCLAPAWSVEGPDRGAQLYGEGERLGLSDAVDYALLDEAERPATDAREPRQSAELTAREWQIARLVGQGLTNPEIAQRLLIGRRTVDTHVEHIRNKLTVRSRAQIAAWLAQREPSG
jgi:non-specific serine/threonine protein kinase